MSPSLPTIPPLDPQRFAPHVHWPVRAKLRPLRASSRVEPHRHGWAQMSFSLTGVSRILTSQMTCIVPPTRAVWIPPQVEHAVAVLRDADMLTLYLHHPPDAAPHWQRCRVVEVSPLLAELVRQLARDDPAQAGPATLPAAMPARARAMAELIGDELLRARSLPLGIALPQDKRLRTLCEALIEEPTRHARLADWAAGSGASARTVTQDYVPLLPWLGVAAWGQAIGLGVLARWPALLQGPLPAGRPADALVWMGRHALSWYMLHQPVMIGAITAAGWLLR